MESQVPPPERSSKTRRWILWLAGIVTAVVLLLGALEGLFGALTETGKAAQKLYSWVVESTSCDRFGLAGAAYLLSCETEEGVHSLRAFSNDDVLLADAFHLCDPAPHWRAQFKDGGYQYEIELRSTGELANTIIYTCQGGDDCPTQDWHQIAGLSYFPPQSPCE